MSRLRLPTPLFILSTQFVRLRRSPLSFISLLKACAPSFPNKSTAKKRSNPTASRNTFTINEVRGLFCVKICEMTQALVYAIHQIRQTEWKSSKQRR